MSDIRFLRPFVFTRASLPPSAAPVSRELLLHVLRGGGGLESLVRIARMTDSMYESGNIPPREQLSADVFYIAPDGRIQVVARRDAAGPVVETRGLIREHYFVPAGVLGAEGG